MSSIMTDDDPRFTLPPLKALQGADFEMLKTVLGDALKQNRLEIALVGDLDEEAAIAAVARSFGALPTRADDGKDYSAQLQPGWSAKRGNFDIPHNGEANQLAWRRIWTTTGDNDQKTTQSMDLLARVATLRLTDELREKLGATYGVSAQSDMSNLYLQRGTFYVSTAGDPKDIATIESTVDQVISALVKSPVDPDVFERARKPVLESYADWKKQNNTWLGVVAEAQTSTDMLIRFRQAEANFASITTQDLWALAKLYLSKAAEFTFRALPDEMVSGGEESAE
jgi:zinc protease